MLAQPDLWPKVHISDWDKSFQQYKGFVGIDRSTGADRSMWGTITHDQTPNYTLTTANAGPFTSGYMSAASILNELEIKKPQ